MRMLFATPLYPPEIGGPATYATLLERELPKHGVSIKTITFSSVRRYPTGIRHAIFFWKVFKTARSCDVLFAQDVFSVGLPTLCAARLLRKPFVVRVPGDFAWEQAHVQYGIADSIEVFQTKKRYPIKIRLYRFAQQLVVRCARVVMTPSEYFSNIVRLWGSKVNPVTVYNGLDIDAIQACTASGVVNTNFSIIAAGRMVPWKGFKDLICVVSDHPTWKLTLVGDGPDRQSLELYARECGVAERVLFPGTLPQQVLWQTLSSHDVLVLNSSFESFSYQVVEAMALGVPVVAPRGSNITELITHEQDGILVSPGDIDDLSRTLARLAMDRDLRQRLSEAAKQKSTAFSIERTVSRVYKLLRSVVGGSHIVFVGTDRSVFDIHSRTHTRIMSYRSFADKLTVLVPTLRDTRFASYQVDNVEFISTQSSGRWRYLLDLFTKLFGLAGRGTIISPQDPGLLGFICYCVARIRGAKLYTQLHTDMFSLWYVKGSWKKKLEQHIARFVLARSDKIRVVSNRIAQNISRVRVSIATIPIIQSADPDHTVAVSQHEHPVFLVVARLEQEKNIQGVITAFAALFRQYKKGTLIIAGDGTLKHELICLAKGLGVEDRVVFMGTVNPYMLYKQATLFIQNSYYEGFGMALIEALAQGCIAASSDVGVAGEVIEHEKNSFIYSVGDLGALRACMQVVYDASQKLSQMKEYLNQNPINARYTDQEHYIETLKLFYET
jgi:glycosyltransferase involved in cell wall biosynthesis